MKEYNYKYIYFFWYSHSREPRTIPVQFILKDNTVKDTLARYVENNEIQFETLFMKEYT